MKTNTLKTETKKTKTNVMKSHENERIIVIYTNQQCCCLDEIYNNTLNEVIRYFCVIVDEKEDLNNRCKM